MYITRVPNRGSPPAVLLRASFREHGKVKTRTLANLSRWPEHKVDKLDRALKGLPPAGWDLAEAFEITRSLPHGHVAAVAGTAEKLGVAELIDPTPSRRRNLVLAMLIGQVTAPGSKLAIARGLRTETATSTLGQILDVSGCDEDDLYEAMDWVLQRKDGIETQLADVIWPMEPWCSMTSPRRRSRATPARWARSGTPETGSRDGARSSTGCCAHPRGCRWPLRCSRAIPPTRKP